MSSNQWTLSKLSLNSVSVDSESDSLPRVGGQLNKAASRYYKENSGRFGQVVPADDGMEQIVIDGQEPNRAEELDLHGREKCSGKCSSSTQDHAPGLQKCKSVNRQYLPTTTELSVSSLGLDLPISSTTYVLCCHRYDQVHKQLSTKTKMFDSEGKSRVWTIILEQSWVTVYKRLHLASFALNLIGLTLAATGYFPYAKPRAAMFALGNILMCVLVRSEVFLRITFWIAVHLLGHWWIPVKMKTMTTAMLQSVGGIHSGCGLGSVMWLVYALVQTFQKRQTASDAILAVDVGILFLLVFSSLAAFPVLRHIHHNIFERVHRLAGWSSLGLVWAHVMLSTFWNPATQSYHISDKKLVKVESLWLTVTTTVIIILPWLSVRKVSVETLVPDTKLNSVLHFEGGVQAGLLARISPSPFSEWHAFGIISDGQQGHTVLAGAVGDFTKSLVENPPTHIWVRTFHFAGLPYLINMYQKVLLVATGSGIGVFLSFLLQEVKADVYVIWIAKNIRESYGGWIWETINGIPSEKLTVIDTAVSGRPKTGEVVVTKAREWGAEVVVVTSNPRGTNEVMNRCKAVGIPVFGPIWDS